MDAECSPGDEPFGNGFVISAEDGYGLRWFTPEAEVELVRACHACSAYVLWEVGMCAGSAKIRFNTLIRMVKRDRKKTIGSNLISLLQQVVPGDISEEIITSSWDRSPNSFTGLEKNGCLNTWMKMPNLRG